MNTDFDQVVKDIQKAILEDAREIYSKKTIEEALNPKNVGEIEHADGMAEFPGVCGDTMWIYLKIENNKIIDSKFITDGCGATIACGSVITEIVKGKTIGEAMDMEGEELMSILGELPEEHLHCPVLAVSTLKKAIGDYKSKAKR